MAAASGRCGTTRTPLRLLRRCAGGFCAAAAAAAAVSCARRCATGPRPPAPAPPPPPPWLLAGTARRHEGRGGTRRPIPRKTKKKDAGTAGLRGHRRGGRSATPYVPRRDVPLPACAQTPAFGSDRRDELPTSSPHGVGKIPAEAAGGRRNEANQHALQEEIREPGGNPRRTGGEHTNSTQKGTSVGTRTQAPCCREARVVPLHCHPAACTVSSCSSNTSPEKAPSTWSANVGHHGEQHSAQPPNASESHGKLHSAGGLAGLVIWWRPVPVSTHRTPARHRKRRRTPPQRSFNRGATFGQSHIATKHADTRDLGDLFHRSGDRGTSSIFAATPTTEKGNSRGRRVAPLDTDDTRTARHPNCSALTVC
ncbi:uncharacterized protein LOC116951124 isoform X2 [Petromyzon marinus]|uniref:uncharacterized protein LOC116951124 isoform X2 n=1 Tax=Petromyzon marinus TaxID=7757 RepID=UPI003F7003F5